VAFDLDHTLTDTDTLRMFLVESSGRGSLAWSAVRHLPRMAAGLRGGSSRDEAKRVIVRELFAGKPLSDAVAAAERTAESAIGNHLRLDTTECLRWHQDQGHQVVIVSASIDLYVRLIASHLGVDHVIATRLDVTDAGILTGDLIGANVRGEEKARALELVLGSSKLKWAYGDSEGDRAMLELSETGRWVGRTTIRPPSPEDEG
jgi:phosphatidylglycerophosphatase C